MFMFIFLTLLKKHPSPFPILHASTFSVLCRNVFHILEVFGPPLKTLALLVHLSDQGKFGETGEVAVRHGQLKSCQLSETK